MLKKTTIPPPRRPGDNKKEKTDQEKISQKDKVSKKRILLLLIPMIVALLLIVFIVVYLTTNGSPGKNGASALQFWRKLTEKIEEQPAETGEEIKEETEKENIKQIIEEESADYASFKLFNFDTEEEFEAWDEAAEAVTYALKAKRSEKKSINGTSVAALGIKTDQGEFRTANWEIQKDFKGVSSYTGTETGTPIQGKLRFGIWLSKQAIGSFEIFLGNDPGNWVKYVLDQDPLKDEVWSGVVIDLAQPKAVGGAVDWTYIDWGRLIITPNQENPQDTTIYLEDLKITDEK